MMHNQLRAFAPYRVCPLGAHVDHQGGLISGFALDTGVELIYTKSDDGRCSLISDGFPGEVRFDISSPGTNLLGDWGDFARGAAHVLSARGLTRGIVGRVAGALPIGGLSSSAAVILCYIQAMLKANGQTASEAELIDMALAAEKDYAGVNVGRLDQSCEVLSRPGNLLFMDTHTQSFELIPKPAHMPEFDIMVFYSGLSRKLGAAYNNRVDESREAARLLLAIAGIERLGARLSDVPLDVYEAHESELPEPYRKRARHYFSECARVRLGVGLWRAGDIAGFGRLMFESGLSSIENYETGSEHLIELYGLLTDAPGVYGGRFSGAGFRGCCVALVDPALRDECAARVTDGYLARFPELDGAYSWHLCRIGSGVGALI